VRKMLSQLGSFRRFAGDVPMLIKAGRARRAAHRRERLEGTSGEPLALGLVTWKRNWASDGGRTSVAAGPRTQCSSRVDPGLSQHPPSCQARPPFFVTSRGVKTSGTLPAQYSWRQGAGRRLTRARSRSGRSGAHELQGSRTTPRRSARPCQSYRTLTPRVSSRPTSSMKMEEESERRHEAPVRPEMRQDDGMLSSDRTPRREVRCDSRRRSLALRARI